VTLTVGGGRVSDDDDFDPGVPGSGIWWWSGQTEPTSRRGGDNLVMERGNRGSSRDIFGDLGFYSRRDKGEEIAVGGG
jgi:hypothetical protein